MLNHLTSASGVDRSVTACHAVPPSCRSEGHQVIRGSEVTLGGTSFWRGRRTFRLNQRCLMAVFASLAMLNLVFMMHLSIVTQSTSDSTPGISSQADHVSIIALEVPPSAFHVQSSPSASGSFVTTPPSGLEVSSAAGPVTNISIEVVSSMEMAAVIVQGVVVLNATQRTSTRGIHVVVLNQHSGAVTARRRFDTVLDNEDQAMILFLNLLPEGRFIVFSVKDEGSYRLKAAARKLLQQLGSKMITRLGWRHMWACVVQKSAANSTKNIDVASGNVGGGIGGAVGSLVGEQHSSVADSGGERWASAVHLQVSVALIPETGILCSNWPHTEETLRRRAFCSQLDGYGSLCSCHQAAPLSFSALENADSGGQFSGDVLSGIAVLVLASDRPQYLYRMLRSLLAARGMNRSRVLVSIDGFLEEPLMVARLFGLNTVQHQPVGSGSGRITQHYKGALKAAFRAFPTARYAAIFEEDLDVSPDVLLMFNHSTQALQKDPSLWCVSAWNDYGYQHTVQNDSQMYRVESMPGLGWMLSRKLFEHELEPIWPSPDKRWDYDIWLRLPSISRGRECLVPDVPRTFHFGAHGMHTGPAMQSSYYRRRALSRRRRQPFENIDRLTRDNYEVIVEELVRTAHVINRRQLVCGVSVDRQDEASLSANVLYVRMKDVRDTRAWFSVAKCLSVWDLDVRGHHRGLWRMYRGGVHLMVVGVPFSPYSRFMPPHVTPYSPTSSHRNA